MFDYFYGQSGEMFSYFRVPKILFRDIRFKDLSTDAKTLYGILLDRMGLSAKNSWLGSAVDICCPFLYTVLVVVGSLQFQLTTKNEIGNPFRGSLSHFFVEAILQQHL